MYFYILILLYNLFIVDIIKNKINKVVNFIDDFLYSLIIMWKFLYNLQQRYHTACNNLYEDHGYSHIKGEPNK